MKTGEKISVIVPVYQVEAYLPCCLDSILAQTYSNLEIILVDDGSQDRSAEICEMYAKKDSRIKVIHQRNQGVSAARNAGLAIATGEWVGFVDGDDWINPEMYEYLLNLAVMYQSNLVQCGIYYEEGGTQEILYTPDEIQQIDLRENPSVDVFRRYFANSSCCKLFRRKRTTGLFFNLNFPIGEDVLFSLSALSLCGSTVFGNQVYYHYRQNANSAVHTIIDAGRLDSARQMFLYAEEKFNRCGIIAGFCRNNRLRNNLDICSKIICNHIEETHSSLIKEIRQEMRTLCCNCFAETNFSGKEQLKSFLIGYFWMGYRWGLPKWKKLHRCRSANG